MLVHYDPDNYEYVMTAHTCAFHEVNPGVPYAGCTCSASGGQKLRSSEEIFAIKARKREEAIAYQKAADIAAARRALIDFEKNGGTTLADLKKELGLS